MPATGIETQYHDDILSYDEMLRIVAAATTLGSVLYAERQLSEDDSAKLPASRGHLPQRPAMLAGQLWELDERLLHYGE